MNVFIVSSKSAPADKRSGRVRTSGVPYGVAQRTEYLSVKDLVNHLAARPLINPRRRNVLVYLL